MLLLGFGERLFFIGTRVSVRLSVCPVTQLVRLSVDKDKRKALSPRPVTANTDRLDITCFSSKIVQIVLNPPQKNGFLKTSFL